MKKNLFRICAFVFVMCLLIQTTLTSCTQEPSETVAGDKIKLSVLIHGLQLADDYKYRAEAQDAINEKLFNELGFKVDITTTSYIDQFDTMLALDLAAGINYDIVRATSDLGASYFEKGMIKDITQLVDTIAPDIKAAVPLAAFAENSFNGKIYGIPTCSFPIMYGMWFRGDWLKILEREVPSSLAELEELMKAIKENTIINKSGSVIPMAGSRDFFEMVFLGMFTDHPGDYVDVDGKVKPKYLDPGYRLFAEKIASWYKAGYINDLLLNGNENVINELIAKDIVGIHVGNAFQLEYTPLKSYNEQKKLDMKWSIPFSSDIKTYYSSGAGGDIVMFPATSTVTEYALKYYNWYYNNKENAGLVMHGIEDKTYILSSDQATGKPFVGIPESEITDIIKQPMDLIGILGTNVFATLQLYYTNPTRPTESAIAYDSCNTQEIFDNYAVDTGRYIRSKFPDTLGTKFNDARDMLIKRVSDIMTGKLDSTDAEWEKMRADFEKLGGLEAYDFLTSEYDTIKDSLPFLAK